MVNGTPGIGASQMFLIILEAKSLLLKTDPLKENPSIYDCNHTKEQNLTIPLN